MYIWEQTRKWSGTHSPASLPGVRVYDLAIPYGLPTEAVGAPKLAFSFVGFFCVGVFLFNIIFGVPSLNTIRLSQHQESACWQHRVL